MKKLILSIIIGGIIVVFMVLYQSLINIESHTGYSEAAAKNQAEINQAGPPWYDPSWHYRLPVIITSNPSIPTYYQILITLDASNFDFSHAMPDGRDLRITDSSGKNLISYWIESWDSQKAYIWVLMSSIPPIPYNPVIYLYYGNPSASSMSNGISTFDFFDDFLQFSGNSCPLSTSSTNLAPNRSLTVSEDGTLGLNLTILADNWCIINGTPSVSSSLLTLPVGTGIKTTNSFNSGESIGFRAMYSSGAGNNDSAGFINGTNGQQSVIGDYPGDQQLYLTNSSLDKSIPIGTILHDAQHTYEIRWISGISSKSEAYVDHVYKATSTSQIPSSPVSIALTNNSSSIGTTFILDWVFLRKYIESTQTIGFSTEQGLVDLGITISDSPDPIPSGKELSYHISINNISSIDAKGVVVTDTLPVNVQFVSATSPLGCTHPGNTVICKLDTIAAGSISNATVVVKPTTDGMLTNTAIVGSQGYELDLLNNSGQQTTLVDTVPPTVSWIAPVSNRQIFQTTEDMVMLEASAADNNLIDRVEFWRYEGDTQIFISAVNASPYKLQFSLVSLPANIPIAFEVFAFDRAGNKSSVIPELRQVIYIKRTQNFPIFLPVTRK